MLVHILVLLCFLFKRSYSNTQSFNFSKITQKAMLQRLQNQSLKQLVLDLFGGLQIALT
jgi:hypothetical protein